LGITGGKNQITVLTVSHAMIGIYLNESDPETVETVPSL